MDDQYILKIGSKGEIVIPKEEREKVGLTKDQAIIMEGLSE
jgi:bifunctional DNA-binding transcriptional regulator/antitoxin component of YhaV-PrlF toxin-antitoxin module